MIARARSGNESHIDIDRNKQTHTNGDLMRETGEGIERQTQKPTQEKITEQRPKTNTRERDGECNALPFLGNIKDSMCRI